MRAQIWKFQYLYKKVLSFQRLNLQSYVYFRFLTLDA